LLAPHSPLRHCPPPHRLPAAAQLTAGGKTLRAAMHDWLEGGNVTSTSTTPLNFCGISAHTATCAGAVGGGGGGNGTGVDSHGGDGGGVVGAGGGGGTGVVHMYNDVVYLRDTCNGVNCNPTCPWVIRWAD
jgi:hypothetical protein